MRIALATSIARHVGGAESYMQAVASLLTGAGHEIALLCEFDGPTERARIDLTPGCPTWNITEVGRDGVPDRLAR
jgi:hypothetical protein